LGEVAEDEEAAIDRPTFSLVFTWISFMSCKDNSRVHGTRTRLNNRGEAINSRIGNPIQETKTESKVEFHIHIEAGCELTARVQTGRLVGRHP